MLSLPTDPSRHSRPARLAGVLLAAALLASACGGEPEPDSSPAPSSQAPAVSDGGGEDAASDGGGASVAVVPQDPYEVTPAPDGFEAPAPCTGEGAHLVELGSGPSDPALPARAGESLTIELTGIEGDHAQLTAAIGDGEPRPVRDATIGETVALDLWTISVTSVCADTGQVEFDLID